MVVATIRPQAPLSMVVPLCREEDEASWLFGSVLARKSFTIASRTVLLFFAGGRGGVKGGDVRKSDLITNCCWCWCWFWCWCRMQHTTVVGTRGTLTLVCKGFSLDKSAAQH